MSTEAGTSALAAAAGGSVPIDGFAKLLQYGAGGLAVVILILAFWSLREFQRSALNPDVAQTRINALKDVQKFYLIAALLMFALSVLAPPILDHFFKAPVSMLHKVAFSLSPSNFDRPELAPKIVVAGSGAIAMVNGTGQDEVGGNKFYLFNVEKLVKELDDARFLNLQQQRQLVSAQGGIDARDPH